LPEWLNYKPKANPCGFIAVETPIRAAICTLPFYHSDRNPGTISAAKWLPPRNHHKPPVLKLKLPQ